MYLMSLMTGVDLPMASSGFSEHPSGRELKKSFRYTKLKNSEYVVVNRLREFGPYIRPDNLTKK